MGERTAKDNIMSVGVWTTAAVLAGIAGNMICKGHPENKIAAEEFSRPRAVKQCVMPEQDGARQYNMSRQPLEAKSEQKKEKPYRNEMDIIEKTARRVGVPAEYLFAIRRAENGRKGLEFGIIPTKRYNEDSGINGISYEELSDNPSMLKQASWCAHTVKKRMKEWKKMPDSEKNKYADFIDFLGDKYCPVGAENDPTGLNENWERNVRYFIEQFKERN